MNIFRVITFTSSLAAVLFLFPQSQTPAQIPDVDVNSTRTVSVTGTGEVHAAPDMAEINVGVVSEAESAGAALENNNEAMNQLLSALKRFGIDDKEIQTTSFNISPRYQHDRQSQQSPKIIGYRVSNEVRVKVQDLKSLGAVLDKVVSAGANQIHGISFSISEPEKLMDQARRRAMNDARRKAELYAAAADAKVGQVMEIREQGVQFPRPTPQRRLAMAKSADAVPIAEGEQTLTARVDVTYSLLTMQQNKRNSR